MAKMNNEIPIEEVKLDKARYIKSNVGKKKLKLIWMRLLKNTRFLVKMWPHIFNR